MTDGRLEPRRRKVPFLDARGRRRLPLIWQASPTECGLACLAMLAEHHGAPVDLNMLRRRFPTSLRGATLANVAAVARRLGFSTRAVRCRRRELARLRTPCILHWNFDHFVVLRGVRGRRVIIHDPARGIREVDPGEVECAFTGIALEVVPTEGFQRGRQPPPLGVWDLVPRRAEFARLLGAGFVLTVIAECLFLLSPLYLQAVIDEVVTRADLELLRTLTIVFAALLAFQVAAATLRALTLQFLGQVAIFDAAARVLSHLLDKPLAYFGSRTLGDIQHRFQALSRVQSFVVTTAPAMLLDGVFLTLLMLLLLSYDAMLTLLNAAALLAWSIVRVVLLPARLSRDRAVARAESDSQTHMLESLRAIVSILSAGGSEWRAREWCDRYATAVNARLRAGNLKIVEQALSQCLLQGTRIATICLLAHQVLDGDMTLGMLTAFVAYLGMFTLRGSGLVNGLFEYRLLRVPLERLGDIVFSENAVKRASAALAAQAGHVELRRIAFARDATSPVLRQCSLVVRSGRLVAIAGASGAGKSTLLRILAGLDEPTGGELLFGGRRVEHLDLQSLRARVATVLQDDVLFSGSIASNIALFDPAADAERIRVAAQTACIDGDIEALPMSYDSRIGDLGVALSEGQVQRVLLARACYRRPDLLLLDEVTSGLDAALERKVVASVRALGMTRVVVTHSDRLLAAADEVHWLHRGVLLSSPPTLSD